MHEPQLQEGEPTEGLSLPTRAGGRAGGWFKVFTAFLGMQLQQGQGGREYEGRKVKTRKF